MLLRRESSFESYDSFKGGSFRVVYVEREKLKFTLHNDSSDAMCRALRGGSVSNESRMRRAHFTGAII